MRRVLLRFYYYVLRLSRFQIRGSLETSKLVSPSLEKMNTRINSALASLLKNGMLRTTSVLTSRNTYRRACSFRGAKNYCGQTLLSLALFFDTYRGGLGIVTVHITQLSSIIIMVDQYFDHNHLRSFVTTITSEMKQCGTVEYYIISRARDIIKK